MRWPHCIGLLRQDLSGEGGIEAEIEMQIWDAMCTGQREEKASGPKLGMSLLSLRNRKKVYSRVR